MILFTALTLAFIVGYLAQSTGICLVKGVMFARVKKPNLLIAILLAGTWSWISFLINDLTSFEHAYRNFQFQLSFIIGGFIFGVGATVNSACSIGTINQLARGNLNMLFTLLGWAIGGVVMLYIVQSLLSNIPSLSLPNGALFESSSTHFITLLCFALLAIAWKLFTRERKKLLLIALLGVVSEMLFLIEPHWTPSNLTMSISTALYNTSTQAMVYWPTIQHFAIFGSTLIGMVVVAVRDKRFNFEIPTLSAASSKLLGGVLMGIGGALALGGNDNQLLIMLPTGSLASISAILSMLLGIYIALRVSKLIATR